MAMFCVPNAVDKFIRAADGRNIKAKVLIEILRLDHAEPIAAASSRSSRRFQHQPMVGSSY